MHDVTIVLTAEEYETLKTGLHYGMNWLRHILIDDALDDDTLDAYSDILQAVWELDDKIRKENR